LKAGRGFFISSSGWVKTHGKYSIEKELELAWLFGVIDHFNSEVIRFIMVKHGDRFESGRAIQQSILRLYGTSGMNCSMGLEVRCDLGGQYTSAYCKNTMEYYGIQISYS